MRKNEAKAPYLEIHIYPCDEGIVNDATSPLSSCTYLT